jgi:hypothetical protein
MGDVDNKRFFLGFLLLPGLIAGDVDGLEIRAEPGRL